MLCPHCKNEITPILRICPKCMYRIHEAYLSVWMKLGLATAIISLFFLPPVCGTIGIMCGIMEFRKNKIQGVILIVANITCMIMGMLLKLSFKDVITKYF